MKQIKLTVQGREDKGRRASRRFRRAGQVPAVLYGKNSEPSPLLVEQTEVSRLLKESGGAASLVELSREGDSPRLSIVSEMQRNPISDQIIHLDFHEVSANEKLVTHVTIHLVGESFGAKNQNGLVEFVSHQVDIRCLPKDLPEFVEVDINDLKVGDSIHVRELPKLDGVEYLADEDHVIVSCVEQRVAVEPSAEEALPAEAEPAAAEKTSAAAE